MISSAWEFVDALMQSASKRDVEFLDASANGKDRNAFGNRVPQKRQRRGIRIGVVLVRRLTFANAIMRGIHIARAAGDQQSIDTVQQRRLGWSHGRDQDRYRAGTADQRFGVARGRCMNDSIAGEVGTHRDPDDDFHATSAIDHEQRDYRFLRKVRQRLSHDVGRLENRTR